MNQSKLAPMQPRQIVSVIAKPVTLNDTEAGRALADRLADAAMAFEVKGNRAVQATDIYGRPIDGMDQR